VRIVRRPLIPGEPDPELIWGAVLLGAFLMGGCWLHFGFPTPLCPLHAMTGIACPTCGMTRAAAALLHGDFVTALAWNPLMTLILWGATLYVFYAAVVVIRKLPRFRWASPTPKEARWIRISVILLIAANWGYLLWRGV